MIRRLAVLLALLPSPGALPAQDLPPQDAIRRMKPAEGFAVSLAASEPAVRQPVTITFDDRGRLWVLQYLQYPNPQGLKAVKVDQYLRTVYDRVPEPPPRGPKGADKITIHEDRDGDGLYETSKDFVTGLNLASGMCLGHGGLYVAQPPYLLFYPDRDRDDVPDSDPEVLLSGFGMEDAHAFANSLQWGPDGWLYGAHGSTVTARIRGIEFQQGLWRFHPVTKKFELFVEGGGNTWGLDFDRHGNAIASTNWGNFAMLHQVQGAYYVKGFSKHGPLHNPHTYGYFDHVPYKGFKGGHVTCGGVVYQGGAFPSDYDGRFIASNPLSNDVYVHVMEREGSTFSARHGGELLLSNDPWFRAVDCLVGPDGALYVADWHDKRLNHVDPRDTWDRTNGRIYRIAPKGLALPGPLDLSKKTGAELVELLGHRNDWFRREARRLLAERRDASTYPALRKLLEGALALQALWTLYSSGGFDDALAAGLLAHPDEDVRAWTVRLVGDERSFPPALRDRLLELARKDPSSTVRSQLACTAKRLPANDGLALVRELVKRDEDAEDRFLPLLLWWAIEDKAISDRGLVLGLLDSQASWSIPIVRKHLVERVARRYAAEDDFETVARLFALAPGAPERLLVAAGLEKALEGRRLAKVPAPLAKPLAELPGSDLGTLRLAFRLGSPEAYDRALALVADPGAKDADRIALLELLGQAGRADCVPVLLRVLGEARSDALRGALIAALQPFPEPAVAARVLEVYPRLGGALRVRAQQLLFARPASTLETLRAVQAGKIDPKDFKIAELRLAVAHEGDEIRALVQKKWGAVGRETESQKRARIANTSVAIRRNKGDPHKGRALYQKLCGNCHALFGEGGKVGPDLTGADRKNLDSMVSNVIDPNMIIRPEFSAHKVLTRDGLVLTGLVVEETPQAITLVDAQVQRTVVARDRIEAMKPSETSLMPEGLIDPLDDLATADLFSYLMGDPPRQERQEEGKVLPGTKPLTMEGDLAAQMVAGIDKFLLREIAGSVGKRAALWKKDVSSSEAYEKSVAPNRERLRRAVGAVDPRVAPSIELVATLDRPSRVGKSDAFEAHAIRWPVFRGVHGEGLLLLPAGRDPAATVVALPDADQTPEQIAGLAPGLPPESQFARRLAEGGCRVIVPVVIDRADTYSVSAIGRATNQPHREFVYRPAFEMGRHVIGYEVQKILAAVDAFEKGAPVGVFGYGEGGLLALFAGALDPRIKATGVSGYFGPREGAWQEPIYRNVFGLLREFGDSELAALVRPRALVIEASPTPPVAGPPAPRQGRGGAAPGRIERPAYEEVRREWARANPPPHDFGVAIVDASAPGGENALGLFLRFLAPDAPAAPAAAPPAPASPLPDPAVRLKRQFDELVEDTQVLLRQSERVRDAAFWKKLDAKSIEGFEKSTEAFREQFDAEVDGRFEIPLLPANPRTRLVYDEPKYRGYEVVLDVWEDVFAYGILLLPKDLKPGERRPVVVCQHGLEGRPQDVADPKKDVPAYGRYACKLAERGFVVFAPQNPYIGRDAFRTLQRKANLLGKHLFSIIIPQHRQITEWLAVQPFVDPERIAFYGLSYGGKTAMRVPAVLKRYCLSICSADFNEWIWKNAATDSPYSYVTTGEYEIFEWNLGNTFNYAEMAALIAPRPFMVERGHHDGVAPDERVAYEYAKVRRLYAALKIPDRTEIEFFDGPHKIHGVGTFEFLHQHLRWPKPK